MAVVIPTMPADEYRTLGAESTCEVREKGSRFIGHAFPVADLGDFKERRDAIAKDHHAARHICYAWVLGDTGERFRAFDAGEPAGSAGKPILRQLHGASLTFSAIVVVRYFGGTLLGKAGLSHAFARAAKDALAVNTVIVRRIMMALDVVCGYDVVEDVKERILAIGGEVTHAAFTHRCNLRIAVPRAAAPGLIEHWSRHGIAAEPMHGPAPDGQPDTPPEGH